CPTSSPLHPAPLDVTRPADDVSERAKLCAAGVNGGVEWSAVDVRLPVAAADGSLDAWRGSSRRRTRISA
ncbi:MAG TPA: hypothetical protein VNK41_06885, partial [Vicinamibacterales bacterium]|nr:hypothetical protein [Vicinamibacterales bacterium]